MSYITESTNWRDRRRHRQQITLAVVLLLIVGAGGVGYAVWSGAIGGPTRVDVSTLPPCPSVTTKPLTPDKVAVNVYNATRRNGLAAKAATALDLRGFGVRTIANDPRGSKVPGTAIVRYGTKGKAAAQLVAAQVPSAKLIRDKRTTVAVDLVLGAKFDGLAPIASATASATPTCRPVTPTPTATGTATTKPTSKPTSKPSSKPTTKPSAKPTK